MFGDGVGRCGPGGGGCFFENLSVRLTTASSSLEDATATEIAARKHGNGNRIVDFFRLPQQRCLDY